MMHTAKRTQHAAPAADIPLLLLKHLSSSKDNDELCRRAARDLHRVSKQHQAEARATLRHLALDRYYRGILSAGFASHDAVPWELLAACPKVTSWKLHPQQLEMFAGGLEGEVAAAASRVKRLEVWGVDSVNATQQQGLGVLLWACNQLEEADITCEGMLSAPAPLQKPWLLPDADSSSLGTAAVPPLPLCSWTSTAVGHRFLAAWVAQQQRAPTLRRLELERSSDGADVSWVTALTGLQDLTLGEWDSSPCAANVSSMSSLTRLCLEGWWTATDAVCALTGLRDLNIMFELPNGITALKQLTALYITHVYDLSLPPDMGTCFPRLERLEVWDCDLEAVPANLPCLTRMQFSNCRLSSLQLPSTLTSLKELVLKYAGDTAAANISSLTALELLDVSHSKVLGGSLTALQPLTRLRHLNIAGARGLDPATFTVLGLLQQLTCLELGRDDSAPAADGDSSDDITAASCSVLAGMQPLPALKRLGVSRYRAGHLAALGPWVAQLTALTKVQLDSCVVDEEGGALLYLPVQLREVHLGSCGLRQLPPSLQRLSALEVLSVSDDCRIQQLPGWLSQLRHLEAIRVAGPEMDQEQEVLAHMPALRCVDLEYNPHCGRVLRWAPHLHFGHSRRVKSYV